MAAATERLAHFVPSSSAFHLEFSNAEDSKTRRRREEDDDGGFLNDDGVDLDLLSDGEDGAMGRDYADELGGHGGGHGASTLYGGRSSATATSAATLGRGDATARTVKLQAAREAAQIRMEARVAKEHLFASLWRLQLPPRALAAMRAVVEGSGGQRKHRLVHLQRHRIHRTFYFPSFRLYPNLYFY